MDKKEHHHLAELECYKSRVKLSWGVLTPCNCQSMSTSVYDLIYISTLMWNILKCINRLLISTNTKTTCEDLKQRLLSFPLHIWCFHQRIWQNTQFFIFYFVLSLKISWKPFHTGVCSLVIPVNDNSYWAQELTISYILCAESCVSQQKF